MRIEALLASAPNRPALAHGDQVLTFAELDALSSERAASLGDVSGQRVLVVGPNTPDFVIGLLAAWKAGAVAVPLGARAREHELSAALHDSGAVAAIAVAEHGGFSFAEALSAIGTHEPSAPLDDEIAAILYTSGSSGQPKGAYLTHDAALHWGRTIAELLALTHSDRTALVLPGSHAFGLACLLACFASQSLAVLVDQPRGLVPAIERHAVTVLHGSPAVFATLPETVRVRTGLVGGAASPPGLIERLDARGTRILNVFGMTEVGPAAACRANDPAAARYSTAGSAMPGYALRIKDGELQVRGQYVTRGYHRPVPDAFDGDWFRTRDAATIDGDGYVTVLGRADEVIHVGGFNVFPAEVENFLLTHPDVEEAAVVGAPHPRMGSVVRAFVVARDGVGARAARPAALRPRADLRLQGPVRDRGRRGAAEAAGRQGRQAGAAVTRSASSFEGTPVPIEALSRAPLLAGLELEALVEIAHAMRYRSFEPGTVVCREGEPGESMFLIVDGLVQARVSALEARALVDVRGGPARREAAPGRRDRRDLADHRRAALGDDHRQRPDGDARARQRGVPRADRPLPAAAREPRRDPRAPAGRGLLAAGARARAARRSRCSRAIRIRSSRRPPRPA